MREASPPPRPPCAHCALPIPPEDLVRDEIDGRELLFCCQGCRGAYRIICGAGLGEFYRRREWADPGTPEGAFETEYDDRYLERFVSGTAEGAEVAVLIDGVRCASCVWVIERILGALPGVRSARVNFATHRAQVRFDPGLTSPARVFRAVAQLGYLPRPYTAGEAERRAVSERKSLLLRFGTAAFLSLQLMGYSVALYAGYFQGMESGSRRLLQVLAGLLAVPVVFYSGAPFLGGAWRSLRNRAPSMDVLIALGVLAAFGYSVWAAWAGREVYFDTAAMIVTLILLGRLFEAGARRSASAGIDRLLRLAPDTAHRLAGDAVVEVESASLVPGDRILVRAGERFPTDGELVDGATEVDESAATGEPVPVAREAGMIVISGTLNLSAAVTVRVTERAADSFMGRVARLVEEAQARRAPVQALADRVAARFVPVVVALAAATFGFWGLRGAGVGEAVLHAVAVLVVACPCALGLATPVAILVATGAASRRGVLFRGGDILEALARVRVAGFDKTGTLTEGRPRVVGLRPHRVGEEELLRAAALAEAGSSHPLARGIAAAAAQRGILAGSGSGARTFPGQGVSAPTPAGETLVGSRRFLAERGVALPQESGDDGAAVVVQVAAGGHYLGAILLEDELRPGAEQAVAAVASLGVTCALLTGDRADAAARLARRVGIREVRAELTPEDKAAWVREAAARGQGALMVGDGINDAPALSAASVGCAMAGGSDIALETSDLVLTRPALERVVFALRLARRTLWVVRENLAWAFAYNAVALPLAASGRLAPVWAAAAMAASSVAVLANSLRLRRGA